MTPKRSRRRSACCRQPRPSTPTGLDVSDDDLEVLLTIDVEGWREAIPQIREHYARFGDDIPAALQLAVDTLERRLTDT